MQLEHNSDQQIPALETSCWLSFWATTVLEGVTFCFAIFFWGLMLFPYPFPLTPKYLILFEFSLFLFQP